jgi:hypothetical protein
MEQIHMAHVKYDICYHEVYKYVTIRFKTHIQNDEYREALNKGIECLAAKKYSNWLASTTSLLVINSEDQEWIKNEWVPKAISLGLRNFAAIPPLSNTGKSVLEKMGKDVSTALFTYKFLEDEESAIDWLTERNT